MREHVRDATATYRGHGLSAADLVDYSAPSAAAAGQRMHDPSSYKAGSEKHARVSAPTVVP